MQGTITYVNEKNWNGKALYSFKLKDDNTLYTCGTTKPQVSRGDFVSFEGKELGNGRVEVDLKTVNVRKAEVVSPRSGGTSWGRGNVDYDKRQETIEWQAARNSAIAAAGVILQAGALKLPAKEADKFGVVTLLISELTNKFFKETKTLGVEIETKPAEAEAAPAATSDEGAWD